MNFGTLKLFSIVYQIFLTKVCKILSTFEGEIFSAKAVVRCIRSFEYYVGVGVFSESPESIIINLGTGHQPGQRDVRPVHCFIRRCDKVDVTREMVGDNLSVFR